MHCRVNIAAFGAAGVAGLPAVDVGDSLGVDRYRANDGIILVRSVQPHCRHHDQPMRVETAGLVSLRSADINSFRRPAGGVDEQVWIRLLRGFLFGVGSKSAWPQSVVAVSLVLSARMLSWVVLVIWNASSSH